MVYLAVDIDTGIQYAVKCLSKFNLDGTPLERRQVAYQQREIHLHYLASAHQSVVSMYNIVDAIDCIYVILEYCPEGDLFLNIVERSNYVGKDDLVKNIFLQVLDAVQHCHNLGIFHRDLKPENILVKDQGETVKLADFGLATADYQSEDYGCGSTFYMSPECLDPSTRKPFYMCAPNDVWSLGVILVNLTCGRNPWKQASFQDSTYRAYARSQEFLKTILPVTDDLCAILGRIFDPNPEQRVTLMELRQMILDCPAFTVSATCTTSNVCDITDYAIHDDAIIDDYECSSPESIDSDDSDEGSLMSGGSTLDDLDEDFIEEQQSVSQDYMPQSYEPEAPEPTMYIEQEYHPQQYTGPVPASYVLASQHALMQHSMSPTPPPQSVCQPKSFFPLWDVVKYVQQAPIIQQHVQFHHQAARMPTFHGFY